MKDPTEYAFDVKAFAIARVTATDEEAAREKLRNLTIDVNTETAEGVRITELSVDDGSPELFAVDGEEV